jgi:hypothetical protein
MESLFRERIHLLKSNSVIELSFSFSFTSLFSLKVKNCSSPKIIILSVYMLIIPNGVPMVVIRK